MSAESAPAPSLSRQKAFIIENVVILNREIKLAILALVRMEVPEANAILEVGGDSNAEINIDLDAVEAANPLVVTHVYNMVRARREILNQPSRAD
jgi:hypothetical protein